MNLLFLTLAAMAADPSSYPAQSALEGGSAVRVDLSAEWLARCPDPTTYMVVSADGVELPYAVRTSDDVQISPMDLRWAPRGPNGPPRDPLWLQNGQKMVRKCQPHRLAV